jgi:hypothetical protein
LISLFFLFFLLAIVLLANPKGGDGPGSSGNTVSNLRHSPPNLCPAPPHLIALPGSSLGGSGEPLVAPSPLPKSTVSSVFSRIYDAKIWSEDGGGSGSGSTLSATSTARALLEMLVYRHHVTRVLDAPCGSSFWLPPLLSRVRRGVPCFQYHGVDVVESVVTASLAKYREDPLTTFQRLELSTPGVGATLGAIHPQGFDLILCRDALQHLPMHLAVNILENFAQASPRLLAVGSYLESPSSNREITTGDYYLINLFKPPFNLEEAAVVDILNEESKNKNERKYLILLSGEYLKSLDFKAMRERVDSFLRSSKGVVMKKM